MSRGRPGRRAIAAIAGGLAMLAATSAGAVAPDERLADPALEARAREIGRELRCLVCQNQSIDDSDAELAQDLRRLVRRRLAAGDSDAEVLGYVVSRYGDFVLLRPPVKPSTWALWFGPPILLLLGAAGVAAALRRRKAAEAARPLSEAEEDAVRRALESGTGR